MKIDDRIKELIGIRASATANCLSCLEYHVGKAVENGADRQEIAVAIAVRKTVGRGAAAKTSTASAADERCGCRS